MGALQGKAVLTQFLSNSVMSILHTLLMWHWVEGKLKDYLNTMDNVCPVELKFAVVVVFCTGKIWKR